MTMPPFLNPPSEPTEVPAPQAPLIERIPPIVFAVLTLCLVFFLYQVIGGIATFIFIGEMPNEENMNTVRWLTVVGQVLLMLIPTLLLARLRHGREINFFRFKTPDLRQVVATVIGVFALQQVLQGYLMLQESVPLPQGVQQFIDEWGKRVEEIYKLLVTSRSFSEFLFVSLVVAVVPAFTEELLFRGLVQRNVERVAGGLKAAVATGVVFAAFHLNPLTIIPLAALGVYFGFIVYRSANISLAITTHFFNNFLACVAAYMSLDEDFLVMSPGTQPSPSVVAFNSFLFLVVFALSTFSLVRLTAQAQPEPDRS